MSLKSIIHAGIAFALVSVGMEVGSSLARATRTKFGI